MTARLIAGVAAFWLLVTAALAQDFTGRATVNPDDSRIGNLGRGIEVALDLSQPVPFRVYTVDKPPRLVVDFREVDWRDMTAADILKPGHATAARMGVIQPGWSRLVVDLDGPLALDRAGMAVDDTSGRARLSVVLERTTEEDFAARSGAPDDAGWTDENRVPVTTALPTERPSVLTVAIDPGHGGIDPGAERDGLREADLTLTLGLELAEAINRTGTMRAVLTRHDDTFVPLAERMTIARANGAQLLVSLHADALEDGGARGGSVYTLNTAGQEAASEKMAERHDRGDLLAGLDLQGQDDTVATVLMDLARIDTAPQSARLADALVAGLRDKGAVLNTRPRREAVLAVLNAADFPSVLVEVGFLSSARDRTVFESAEGRGKFVAGLVEGITRWAVSEEALAPLLRR